MRRPARHPLVLVAGSVALAGAVAFALLRARAKERQRSSVGELASSSVAVGGRSEASRSDADMSEADRNTKKAGNASMTVRHHVFEFVVPDHGTVIRTYTQGREDGSARCERHTSQTRPRHSVL